MSTDTIHMGRKEAFRIASHYGVGNNTVRRWFREEKGLHVILPGRTYGVIVRARLMAILESGARSQQ